MFVDIHSHILPNIDDGSNSEATTLKMLRTAEGEGIVAIIATPHFIPGYNSYDEEQLQCKFELVNSIIKSNNINISFYLGSELFIDIDAIKCLANTTCHTLADSDYVLVELPIRWNSTVIENLLYNIGLQGYKIILAHIERYDYLMDNPSLLRDLIMRGVYTQVNASTVLTKDKKIRNNIAKLLKNNYVHFIATDCHSNGRRKPLMKEAYGTVQDMIGSKADELFYLNGRRVIANEYIEIGEPALIKRFLFSGRGFKWSRSY